MHEIVAAYAPMMRPRSATFAAFRPTLADVAAFAVREGLVSRRFLTGGSMIVGDAVYREPERWPSIRLKENCAVTLAINPADPLSIGAAIGGLFFSAGASVAVVNAVVFGVANLLPGVIALGLNFAANALFTTPQNALGSDKSSVAQANSAGITQNVPRRGQPYPVVFGTARVAPQPICFPRTWLSGDNVYAEAVLALAGPHAMSDVRVGSVPIEDDDSIEAWIDDGTAAARTNIFSEYAHTAQIGSELSAQDIRVGEDGYTDQELRDQAVPANSLPPWTRCASRREADRLELRLVIRNPFDAGAGLANQIIWFRLRARQVGTSTWKNIATLPYRGNGQGEFRRQIVFHFSAFPGGIADAKKSPNGFITPSIQPAVTENHAVIKTADGERFPAAYSFVFRRNPEGIDIWIDGDDAAGIAYFGTGGEFEFDIQRSEMVEQSELGESDTDIAQMRTSLGNINDYFDARLNSEGKWVANENTDDQGDQVYLESAVSVFEQPPVPENASIATLHVRVKNKQFSDITVLASALVPNWDGAAFTGLAASSNPADHYRAILAGDRNVDPLSPSVIDDEGLGEWRDECAARGYEVNLAYFGTIGEALRLVASCGYARPLEGLKFGVAYYRDTSAEHPVQMFTPRNIANYSWSTAFSKRPGALLCKFLNADKEFAEDEIVVEDPFEVPGATGEVEEVEFPGFTTVDQVTARARFDFAQAHNAVRHRFTIGWEFVSSQTRPGNLAILSHDALHAQAAWGRVSSVVDGTHFAIDSDIEFTGGNGSIFDVADIFALENVFAAGADWAVAVRAQSTGDVRVLPFTAFDAGTRTGTTPDTSGISEGDLCVFGPLEQVTRRVLILEVNPQGDDACEIVAQDEQFSWAAGSGTPVGWLADRLAIEPDVLAIDFAIGKALVRDATTAANAFFGDVNQLLAYVSPSAKHIRTAAGLLASGTTLRVDHDADGNALGLLIESQRTNTVLNSEDLTAWGGTAGTLDAAIADPTGATGTVCYGSSPETFRTTDGSSATVAALSFFAKARTGGGGDAVVLQLYQSVGGGDGVILLGSYTFSLTGANSDTTYFKDIVREEWPNGWYRFKCRVLPNTGAGSGVFTTLSRIDIEGGTYRNYVWGVQFEPGATFASSYIKTTGSAVTRAADDISLALSALPFSATAGTLAMEFVRLSSSQTSIAALSAGASTERIQLFGGTITSLYVEDGGVAQASINAGASAVGVASKLAAAWSANDFAASLDGATAVTDASGTIPAVTDLHIGSNALGTGNHLDGHLKSLTWLPRRATDAQLEALAA